MPSARLGVVSTPRVYQQGLCEARLGYRDGSPQLGAPGPGLERAVRHCMQSPGKQRESSGHTCKQSPGKPREPNGAQDAKE